jgi:7,8-dihydropterin-6-yl-methyl-4-(beta-D-ribofuranosyl)aminobenzene 5'-phosphate synthase
MMIKVLVENTTASKELKCIHGLSLYIETGKHKLLFDLGPGKLFLENAAKMDIKIEEIDTVVISHGHYDHGGALKAFLEKNHKAKIYIKESAFEQYYSSILGIKVYIGLDRELKSSDRFVYTKDDNIIDDELQLFSNIIEHKYLPKADKSLYKKVEKQYTRDNFDHEQNLIITENNAKTLVAGCAHNGIYNIVQKAEQITGTQIDTVISGFHLFHLSIKDANNLNYLHELATVLKAKPTKYYTCHCTGQKPYEVLHNEMGEQMNYISTGRKLEL